MRPIERALTLWRRVALPLARPTLVAVGVLTFLVFKPVLRILARRQQLTVGNEKEAAALSTKTEGLINEHAKRLQEARTQGIALKEKFQKEGVEKAGAVLGETRRELEGQLEKARQEISHESKTAQLTLRQYTRELARELAQKILGRKVSG